jgi:hypothetical protein
VRPEQGRSRRGFVVASDIAVDPPDNRSPDGAERHPGSPGFAPLNPGYSGEQSQREIWWLAGAAVAVFVLAMFLWVW